jgi:hypothetical protein
MELLNRYLQAIEFWLPKRQKHDIIAELSEDLRSQFEEKETELGRKLNDEEVEAILKRCGSPVAVASRYRPQQYLIGPILFPVYRFVLAVLLIGCVVPRFLIWLGFLIADPAHSGYLHMENMGTTVVFFAFCTTLAFAVLERSGAMQERLNTWNPRQLPAVRDRKRIPRSSTLFEIASLVVVNLWFASTLWPRPVIDLYGAQVTLAPVWRIIFWSVLSSVTATGAIGVVNLFRPYWTPLRAGLRLVVDASGGAIFCWFLKARVLVAISAPSLPAAKAAVLTNVLNMLLTRTLPWAVVAMLVILSFDVYRIVRLRGGHWNGGSMGPAVKGLSNPVVNGN